MLGSRLSQATVTLLVVLPGPSLATLLYLTDQIYHGITTLELTGSSLAVKIITPGCGEMPSWVTHDLTSNRLFCMDESKTNGTIASYTVAEDGALTLLSSITTLPGAAHGALFGQGNGLAVAHHVSSSVATYDVSKSDPKTLQLVQSETYHLAKEAIHPVGELEQSLPDFAITDPSGKFLLVPDPGADFVRIYLLNEDGRLRFTALSPLIIPGGPRYADFLVTFDGTVYLYVTTANTNMIKGYKVSYTSGTTIGFTSVQESKTSTNVHDVGGDIHVSPDGKFLLVSSRGKGSITIPGGSTSPEINSDPIITYSIDHSNGNLTRIQTFAAGGVNPRQFSISKDGSMIAVSLFAEESKKVTVIARDVHTGKLTHQIAGLKVDGWPSCVIFKDENLWVEYAFPNYLHLPTHGPDSSYRLQIGPGGAKDTSHLLLNKKWIFLAFFGVVFFVWQGISCCMSGRRKISWYLEHKKYSSIGRQEQEGEELVETPTGTAEDGNGDADSKFEAVRGGQSSKA